MSAPENFFERLREFSGPTENFCEKRGDAVKNNAFWIRGLRLQDDCIGIELLDKDGNDCECFIGIEDLVDGFEDFIKFSHPDDAKEYKAATLTALRKAINRIKVMESL